MDSDAFEKSFADFIDGRDYNTAQYCMFSIVRNAYMAGWQAAKGCQAEQSTPITYPTNTSE